MTVTDLRCESLVNPLGLGETTPRLSWRMTSDEASVSTRQTGYRLRIASTPEKLSAPDLWDSGNVLSDTSLFVPYAGATLTSLQRAYWNVTVTDAAGNEATSDTAFFEMGLLDSNDWQAEWIGSPLSGGPRTTSPAPYLRTYFQAENVVLARLCITALGLYEAYINGKRVGDDYLTPGWTDYAKRVQYQVYDVTGHLQSGENILGAILGDGWYCGHIGWRERQWYGDRPKLLAQLHLTFADGSTETITSNNDWEVAFGPILENDLLMGEVHDARKDLGDWSLPRGASNGEWQAVHVFEKPATKLSAMQGPTVRLTETLKPIAPPQVIGGWPANTYIYDLGQNMVGTVRFTTKGKAGDTVRLRYAETLKGGPAATSGPIYIDNLRSAKQTDYFTLKGDPDGETFEPRLTFHGFRYVEVYGVSETPGVSDLVGLVLHSDTPKTGDFVSSDKLINQLQRNIDWGQRGNYLDVPTDCPQRDERLGWTGDAQVFVRTAAFNRDVLGFYHKWMQDLRDAQTDAGELPPFAPNINLVHTDGGPAWADAGVICPYVIYRTYGDTKILSDNYAMMTRFIAYLETTAKDDIRCYDGYSGFMGFGDWLALDGSGKTEGGTPKDLIGTAYLAYSSRLLGEIALILGKPDDAAKYQAVFERVRATFQKRYITPQGLVYPGTQTAYTLALHFDLMPPHLRDAAASELVRDIRSRGLKQTVGFVGSSYLPHVLTATGHLDIAFRLLHATHWPSYLYAVTQGATTIWERWDGWTGEKGFQDAGMNSFNHYAYGAIGAWLYQIVAGIELDPQVPGYKKFVLQPHFPPVAKGLENSLTSASAHIDTLYGRIESAWERHEDGGYTWRVTVPANTEATAYAPLPTENAIVTVSGATETTRTATAATYPLSPGTYQFTVN